MKIGMIVGMAVLSIGCNEKESSKEATPVAHTKEAPEKTKKEETVKKAPKKIDVKSSLKDTYKKQAESLIAAIDGAGAADVVMNASLELTKTGLLMIPSLIKMNPVCTEYLNAILAIGPTLHTIPLDEIESGYHADGKLPKVSAAECYHGKDLVVHPATVSALAKAGLKDREKAKHEIEEVLEHLGAINFE